MRLRFESGSSYVRLQGLAAPACGSSILLNISDDSSPAINHKMDSYIPKPLAQILATIGLLFISAKVVSYVRLLASLFLIPGVPVSSSTTSRANHSNKLSSPNSVPRVVGWS